jgi:Ser-tRNA(Ala) deacylase AlaX
VLSASEAEVVTARSPLVPARPGRAGDRGWLQGTKIVDAHRVERGVLHVLAAPTWHVAHDWVLVEVDLDRRDRLVRIDAVVARLRWRLEEHLFTILGVEIEAGIAWLDVLGPQAADKVAVAEATAIEIDVRTTPDGVQTVEVRLPDAQGRWWQ